MRRYSLIPLTLLFSFAWIFIFLNSIPGQAAGHNRPAIQITATPAPVKLAASLPPNLDVRSVSPVAPLTIAFSQPMDPASAQPALLTLPYAPGELAWNEDHTRLTFTPAANLAPDADYLIFLDRDLRSANGEHFAAPQQWEIHTRKAPQVVKRQPAGPDIGTRTPGIYLSFNQAMDADSVAQAFTIQPAVPFEIKWQGERKLEIDLLQPLDYRTRYRFSLGPGARDTAGVPLSEAYIWEYRVNEVHVELWPESGQVVDYLDLRFSQAIDPEKSGLPFTITPTVSGTWNWLGAQTARFKADQPFSTAIQYSIQFDNILIDAQGDPVTLAGPVSFYARPPISWTYPAAGNNRYSYQDCTAVKITFERPMDRASTEAAFQITPAMEGTFAWAGEKILVFTPTVWIESDNQIYTAALQPTALDDLGQPILGQPFEWSFRCWVNRPGNDNIDLGEENGADIQVLDAEGRRALHFANFRGIADLPATFRLYQFDLNEFVQRYLSKDGFDNLPEKPFKSWQARLDGQNVQEFFIPEDVPPGLYILRLSASAAENADLSGEVDDHLFLVLTYNTLIVKRGVGQVSAWLTNINGRPVSEPAEVYVYDWEGALMARGAMDREGSLRLPFSGEREPALVFARTKGEDGEDYTMAGMSERWDENMGWSYYNETIPLTQLKIYAYTDRPIYRPGQTVYFKAIVRKDDDARYSLLPAGTPVTVRLRDARQNALQTLQTQTNAFGSLNGEFRLDKATGPGEYELQFELEGESHRQLFKVQDYRKPDFKVELKTDAESYIDGEKMHIDIDTRYFYGQPVAKANLNIRIYGIYSYYSWWWDGESQDSDENEHYRWSPGPFHETNRITDATGHFTLTLPATMPEYEEDRWYWWGDSLQKSPVAIEVTADDGSHQTVSAYKIVHIFNAAERLSLQGSGYYLQAGQPFFITATAQTLEGKPVVGRDLTFKLDKYNWSSWHHEPITQTQLTTGPNGKISLPLTLKTPGYYSLVLTGKDAAGHAMQYEKSLEVLSQYQYSQTMRFRRDDYASDYYDGNHISISVEQKKYRPYQTARFMVASSFSGPALLTFERSQVYRSMPIRLTAPTTLIEVPILESDAPNTFVTVNAWQARSTSLAQFKEEYPKEYTFYNLPDSRLRTDRVEIQVDATSKALKVNLSSNQPIYAAGQTATFTIQVNDVQGRPADAEVSLALVDESIYSLSRELSPPIFNAFYGRRELKVTTFDSMAPYREIISGDYGGGGGDVSEPDLRSDFEDTAVWLPALETGEDGIVTATLALPDNLTSWRLTARAITQDTRVGDGHLNILTQREVVVQPALPRSLVVSDDVSLSALVHNYGPERTFDLSLEADLLEVAQPTQQIHLAAGESRQVSWQAIARQPGQAQVTIQANAQDGSGGDAIRLPLEIRPLAIPYNYSQAGSFQDQYITSLTLPENALDSSTVQVQLSRSIGGSLLKGLEFLTGYPYGCVEQTMSRALPNAVIGRALARLGSEGTALNYDLDHLVEAGLGNLYSMQHLDGGWGWWHDDDTNDYQTAWVVFGLAVTADAGYPVEPKVIQAGADWLVESLDEMDIRTRAFALYSLAVAGQGQPEAALALAKQAYQLDAFSQAALALALAQGEQTQAALALLDNLATSAAQSNGDVYWPTGNEDGEYRLKTMSSDIRTTALALQAFLRIRPDDPRIPQMVHYLMSQRQFDGWGSTNETAFTILALTDYIFANQVAAGPANYRLELNGQELLSGTLSAGTPAVDVTIPISQMVAGLNPLTITQDTDSPLYYALNSQIAIPYPAIQSAGDLLITRTYHISGPDAPLQTFPAGQLVKVVLQVEATTPGAYIMLTDHLPGGLEALNTNLNITSHEALIDDIGNSYERFYWQDYGYNNKELRDDRVIFFFTWMGPGVKTISYLARATQPGTFTALPAELSAMYDPDLWARSASTGVTVTP